MSEHIDIKRIRELVRQRQVIMNASKTKTCPDCGGEKRPGTTTFTVDLGFGVVVVRSVPALVCSQCGADWLPDEVAERLEIIVEDARKRHRQVEVTAFQPA